MANTALTRSYDKSLILTASPSGASTVVFTDLTSTYAVYEFQLLNIDCSADNFFRIRTSTNNGSSYDASSTHYSRSHQFNSTTTTQDDATNSDGFAFMFYPGGAFTSGGASANESFSGSLFLYKPSDAQYTQMTTHFVGSTTSSGILEVWGGGFRKSAADVDAVQFSPSTGTFSGEIRVFGYKDA